MSKSKKLSAIEQRDRQRLEKIARDCITEGLADLAKIEATGIWRETHETFDAYCFDRLGFNPFELDIESLIQLADKAKPSIAVSNEAEGG